jgi:hypothetical protein
VARKATFVARGAQPFRQTYVGRTNRFAAAALGDVRVLGLEPLPRQQERGLNRRAAHIELLRDLAVGHALELAHDERACLEVAELIECALEVDQALLVDQQRVRRG